MKQQPGLTECDIVLAVTSISFDIAALELYLPLIYGASVVLVSREVAMDGELLSQKIAASDATIMQATPATWQMLITSGWVGSKQLKILCGGEALSRDLAEKLIEKSAEVWNLYGPTETTIWSTVYRVKSNQLSKHLVPIGRPIANTQIYILDKQLQLVPVGVPGELHISGIGLARGYLNRPQLTNEKFIANPFSNQPGEKLYKTGDLARYLPNGAIEYLGRIDNQVKIRGFRIELEEIETVLQQIPEIKQAVTIVRNKSNNQRIVAYIVPDSNSPEPQFDYLREFLQQKLPDYMIPSAFMVLNSLPLTPNGKLDRRALPAAEITLKPNHQNVLPRTPIEEKVAKIWGELLGLTKISIHENFFELGGHSLLATQVMSKIRQTWQIELSLSRLFEMPTIALFSAEISKSLEREEEKSIINPQPLSRKARRVKLSSLNTETKTNN